MKYLVRYDTSMSKEQKQEILDSLNVYNIENGYPLLTDTGIPDVSTKELRVCDRAELDYQLLDHFGISKDKVISVEVLEDDSMELLKDHEILAIADEEPTCANYDWSTDNVMSFARKLLAKFQEAQHRDTDRLN